MSDRRLLADTVRAIMTDHGLPGTAATDEASWSAPLWQQLSAAGLTGVGVPEELGGSGGDLADAAVVVRIAAAHAAPLPLAETLFPVAAGCVAAHLPLPGGPATLATGSGLGLTRRAGGVVLDGTVRRVPYARTAHRMLVVADAADGPVAALVEPARCAMSAVDNLAGEPRDDVTLAGVQVAAEQVGAVPAGTAQWLLAMAALARAVQIAGALQAVLDLTVRYAGERLQFGRPIGRFQAVAHQVALLAGAAVSVSAAVEAAVAAVSAGDTDGLAIAAAKTRASAVAGPAARMAHQVHGAIGFTQEHRLHHLTRRLWSWREEFGSEEHWAAVLGAEAITRGGDRLWPTITEM